MGPAYIDRKNLSAAFLSYSSFFFRSFSSLSFFTKAMASLRFFSLASRAFIASRIWAYSFSLCLFLFSLLTADSFSNLSISSFSKVIFFYETGGTTGATSSTFSSTSTFGISTSSSFPVKTS